MAVPLNDHGQPIGRNINWARVRDSRIDELIGLCRGIMADGVIVFEEAAFLYDWLKRNDPVCQTFAGQRLYNLLTQISDKKQLDEQTEPALVDLILRIIGGTPLASVDASYSSTLPLDDPQPQIQFVGSHFCFTGKFVFGTRPKCQQATIKLGGGVHGNPKRDTSFLVIGEIGSRDWLHSTSGLKIERAMDLRSATKGIRIVSEATWANAVQLAGWTCD